MSSRDLEFKLAKKEDLSAILAIARYYAEDFATYLTPFPSMIENERVFVVKRSNEVLGFAAYGVSNKDPLQCITSSARSPKITREALSGDWMRTHLEEALIEKGFRKFTAHVRPGNSNAIKMLLRNGYKKIESSSAKEFGLLEYRKIASAK